MTRYSFVLLVLFISITWRGECQHTEASQVYIFNPYNSKAQPMHLFFNRKMVHSFKNGERLMYTIPSEGILKMTVLNSSYYRDPNSLDGNTRSVSIKKGKSYYFEIGSKGEITYIVNLEKGKEKYNESKNFSGQPVQISQNVPDSLLIKS